jgi:WW domain-binding protein 4
MSKKREAPWRNAERHYCAVCNTWMGGDRQSILIHENGKKHKENLEKSLQDKRQSKRDEEQAQKLMQSTLQKIHQAANESYMNDSVAFGDFYTADVANPASLGYTPVAVTSALPAAKAAPAPAVQQSKESARKEKQEWESRKKKREESNSRDKNDDAATDESSKKLKRSIGPDEGHYMLGDHVYLEGSTFYKILEEDMPVQIWTGPVLASLAERRLPEREHQWTNGLVVAMRHSTSNEWGMVVDAAYLQSTSDEEETLETSILPHRIRIKLGADESIPKTIEEARLLAMGGEEIQIKQEQSTETDEATGLSSWNTVSIRRTTVHQELKEERARLRQQRRDAIAREEQQKKELEARKMEEAKVENADDSALGAYDVWSSGKAGYKGIDISKQAQLDIHDTAKSLAKGMGPVEFKKPAFAKKGNKTSNRRKTTADDDDED